MWRNQDDMDDSKDWVRNEINGVTTTLNLRMSEWS